VFPRSSERAGIPDEGDDQKLEAPLGDLLTTNQVADFLRLCLDPRFSGVSTLCEQFRAHRIIIPMPQHDVRLINAD
jgi:hypothetical protein